MTRAEMVARIQELQTQVDSFQPDPLKSDTETLAQLTSLRNALAGMQERLRRLEAHR